MRNNETGRSMVEMLGVLAIIGVLSVAGIAGYAMAMKKMRVNDVMAAATQCAVLARTFQGGSVAVDNKDCVTVLGVDSEAFSSAVATGMTASYDGNDGDVTVTITAKDADYATLIRSALNGGGTGTSVTKAYDMD